MGERTPEFAYDLADDAGDTHTLTLEPEIEVELRERMLTRPSECCLCHATETRWRRDG